MFLNVEAVSLSFSTTIVSGSTRFIISRIKVHNSLEGERYLLETRDCHVPCCKGTPIAHRVSLSPKTKNEPLRVSLDCEQQRTCMNDGRRGVVQVILFALVLSNQFSLLLCTELSVS